MGYLHQADVIMAFVWAGYQICKPSWIFNAAQPQFQHLAGWNFGGGASSPAATSTSARQFKNYWSAGFGVNRQGESSRRRPARRPGARPAGRLERLVQPRYGYAEERPFLADGLQLCQG